MLTSQAVMLQRLGRKVSDVSDEEMAQKFEKHLRDVKDWLERQSNIDVIYVKYNDVINSPYENARIVSEFLGDRLNVGEWSALLRSHCTSRERAVTTDNLENLI